MKIEELKDDLSELEIEVKNNVYKGYFTNGRIKENVEGWYAYDIRHGDSGDFCTLEPHVLVNHTGTFLCASPIDMDKGYVEIMDWNFLS